MTDRIDPTSMSDPRDQAAYWYERMHSDDLTDVEQATFEQWRDADPQNARRYQQVEGIWSMAAALPKSEVRKLGAARQVASSVSVEQPSRRAFWGYGLGAACAAALMVAIVDPIHWRAAPTYQETFASTHGERRQIVLPDNSTLLLNTDTSIFVAFYDHQRVVRLEQGEVFFQVDGTQGTPFIVDAGNGSVRVRGTQFNVRHTDQGFSVDVLKGEVEVKAGPWWNRQTASLRRGQAARSDASGSLTSQQDADVDSTVAWRKGKVVFRGTPLVEAIQELNRYSSRRMIVREVHTGQLRISGVFSVDDPASFLGALPKIVPVVVRQHRDSAAVDIVSQ